MTTTKETTMAPTKTTEPLSVQIEQAEAAADALRAQQREAQAEAQRLADTKRAAELEAERAWSERNSSRIRQIYADVDKHREAAYEALAAGDMAAAANAWLRWRIEVVAAPDEWGVIRDSYTKSHPGERAMPGRQYLGGGPGTTGETWEQWLHQAVVKVARDVAAQRRNKVLADLAAAIGTADLGAVEAGLTPVARFYRGAVINKGFTDEVVVPRGGVLILGHVKVAFAQDGHANVYDEATAGVLRQYAASNPDVVEVRMDVPEPGDGDG
jgi:hypothetical protein